MALKNPFKKELSNVRMLLGTALRKPAVMGRLVSGYYRARFLGEKRLRFMDIALDYRCNMKCHHCSATNFVRKDDTTLELGEFERICDDLAKEGCMVFHFTGGEPLLRADLEDYIRATKPHRAIISIQSNGLRATPERLRSLREAGADILNVSLDSADPEENDRFRNLDGAWQRTMDAIENARDAGFEVSIATTISHTNLHSSGLHDLIELAASKKLWCQFNLAVPVGNWRDCGDFILTEEDQRYWRSLVEKHPHLRIDLHHNWHKTGCGAVKEKGYLTAYGDVMPCPFIQVSLGNLREKSISEVRERALKIREFDEYWPRCLAAEEPSFIAKVPCYNDWKGPSPVPIEEVDWMMDEIAERSPGPGRE